MEKLKTMKDCGQLMLNVSYDDWKCLAKTNDSNLILINTHLLANYFNRDIEIFSIRRQLNQLIDTINSFDREPILLAGDFNFAFESDTYNYFLKKTNMANPLGGMKGKLKNRISAKQNIISRLLPENYFKLDYMFFKNIKNGQILDKKIMFDSRVEGVYLSDHSGVLIKFMI